MKTRAGCVQVCSKTFISILGISRDRIQRVCRMHLATGQSPKEKRGGDRRTKIYSDRRDAVTTFISKLKPVESHYSREKSTRHYLPSDCSIKKLWRLYNNEIVPDLKVKYHFFRDIFVHKFNISFRHPATDVCSECIRLKRQISSSTGSKKNALIACYRVHKLKAKAFYGLIKKEDPSTLVLSFDCQKNLVLPKIPDQSTYYSRQLYQFNFTICQGHSKAQQTKDRVTIYTWCENESKKGSNEIASAIYDTLSNATLDNMSLIRLFADGCPGQNKNSTVVGMLAQWFSSKAPRNIKSIEIIFPIVGHSFLPPDRIFGRIEKIVRKKDTIITPAEYTTIFSEFGVVKRLSSDVPVFDWKAAVASVFKSPGQWHFKFSPSKRIILSKTKSRKGVLLRGEVPYHSDLCMPKSVLKKGKFIHQVIPTRLETGVPVKELKLRDVDNLLGKHFGIDWRSIEELGFYRNVLDNQMVQHCETTQDEAHEDEMCEHDVDADLVV